MLIVKNHGLNCILYLTQKPQINAEVMRGSLYIMETFAERAHSACAPCPDGKAQIPAQRVNSMSEIPAKRGTILNAKNDEK